jgi:molybdopterin-guanine dinucleotide biosynthesis protein A
MHTPHTLKLDETWDVTLNEAGHIAVIAADAPYATAQNVANECRLFTRDAYFAYDRGIPHFVVELGRRRTRLSALKAYLRRAALRDPKVAKVAAVRVDDFDRETRTLSGAVTLTLRSGENVALNL